jgi:hypothetical protein
MLTNECWLGYHGNCELEDNCDCICHEAAAWADAYEDGPVIAAMWEEAERAVEKWLEET